MLKKQSIYKFMSTNTGELETNVFGVIKATLFNLWHYKHFTFWSYNKNGF